MSNSEIEQSGTVKGHLPNEASLSGRISNGLSLSGHISIGRVAGDFIIKMTVESDGDYNYTVASCDATIEQIDAAVSAEKRVVLIASVDGSIFELPMVQGVEGNTYYFGVFSGSQIMISFVEKIGNTSNWEFDMNQIQSEDVGYSNAALPSGITNVKTALDELVPKSHSHANKSVLDKFAESDGMPTYDGQALGGGTSDFIIKMTVEYVGDNYTVTSCDATVEQIDAAVAAEKRVILIATQINSGLLWEMPIVQGSKGNFYYFGTFLQGKAIAAFVLKDGGESGWLFVITQIKALDVDYSNNALPGISTVEEALNVLVPKSHTHANKDTLDKLSDSNGKLQYNGSDVGLKGDKGDTGAAGADGYTPVKGTDYWTAADKAEIVADTLAALPTWTGGSY